MNVVIITDEQGIPMYGARTDVPEFTPEAPEGGKKFILEESETNLEIYDTLHRVYYDAEQDKLVIRPRIQLVSDVTTLVANTGQAVLTASLPEGAAEEELIFRVSEHGTEIPVQTSGGKAKLTLQYDHADKLEVLVFSKLHGTAAVQLEVVEGA